MTEIKGMTIKRSMVGRKKETELLAFFDAQLTEVYLRGCALVRYSNGKVTIWPPKLDHGPHALRGVFFADENLKRRVADRALDAYRALGGE